MAVWVSMNRCIDGSVCLVCSRDWGHCLDDLPSEHDFNFPILPAGVMYDIDHQCRLQYGPDAEYCDGIDVCHIPILSPFLPDRESKVL